ncbi:MAG: asparagine--tRNA ligase [Chloroflexi bacterium]|nr:asparagine--tRNA ligase [Chloroflexota bacterium]MCI0580093.1 asparagine--tRNA ligase [Chloroflexota bacterium]MCI0649331.1 asparagine--tRNA ligase [Chloroflexota bacterium]MCI0726027.1 asparagine--tRNA ligase [Chloroflexota bacterium]
MATTITIQDIADYEGQEVTLKGWLYLNTGKGKLQFLRLRDGTGIVQCVAFRPEIGDETFEALKRLGQESSLILTGTVRKDERAPGLPGGYEVGIKQVEVVQDAVDYPIGPKEHGVEFLMDNRHLWLRSSLQWAIMRVRATIKRAIIDFLDSSSFLNIDTPIITPAAAEGTSTLFEVDYFDEKAYLAQTGQLYNEANIMAFGKVYCFGPTFRAEKSKTRRHLAEFWMVEPEMAFFDLDDLMAFEEEFVSYIVQTTLRTRRAELELLGRDLTFLENVKPPFPRISYDEAVERLQAIRETTDDPELKELLQIEWGADFGSPHETELTKLFDRPVFVYGYPTQVKAFYMEPWPGRPEVCKSVDLLAPEGYGEIIGGSERMSNLDVLVEAINRHELPLQNYQWYIDLRRYGTVPHSGFGLGLERTVAWICGLAHIREASPYPRTLNRMWP